MTLTTFAEKMGRTYGHIQHVKSGNRGMTKQFAEDAEKVSGIQREQWMWPDRNGGDPWEQLKKI